MPFYEYQCKACGAQVEVLQKITDAPLKKCPECGRNQLQKLVSAPLFRLAGGGWYETDFKGDKDRKRNLVEKDAGEAKPSGDKPEAKADKPAESSAKAGAEKPAAKPVKPANKAARRKAGR